MTDLVEIENVRKVYRRDTFEVPVLNGISLGVPPGETYHSGAAIPFTVTPTPSSVVGNGIEPAAFVVSDRCVPYRLMSMPGANACLNDAAFCAPVMLLPPETPARKTTGTSMNWGVMNSD